MSVCFLEIASISTISLDPLPQLITPPIPEKEMAVFAFSPFGESIIIYTNNGLLARECNVYGSSVVVGWILDVESPDHGIWIWEGHAIINKGPENSPSFDWEFDIEFVTDLWRQPTEKEWKAISEQRNPFEDEIRHE